jgi:hypothetical protein
MAKGRFLGVSVGLNVDSSYGKTWWGEGEVKMYLDGDSKYPPSTGQVRKIIWEAPGVWENLSTVTRVARSPVTSSREYNFYAGMFPTRSSSLRISVWSSSKLAVVCQKSAELLEKE